MPADGAFDIDLEPQPNGPTGAMPADDGSGDLLVNLDPEDPEAQPGEYQDVPHDANLAEFLGKQTLTSIGQSLCQAIDEDLKSRREWEQGLIQGLKYLGTQPNETRTKPFKGASGVYDAMMLKAVIRFQATAFKELQPAQGPVKTQIIGASTMENMPRATRQRTFMNYYLTTGAPEFRPEFRSMLWWIGLEGSAFKKTYFDDVLKRVVSPMIRAQDVIVPYGSTDLFTAIRVTHRFEITDREIKMKQLSGEYLPTATALEDDLTGNIDQVKQAEDIAIGMMRTKADIDKSYTFYECQAYINISQFPHRDPSLDPAAPGEPTGLPLPYRVTIDRNSQQVFSIRRNWNEADESFQRESCWTHYVFIPGMGFYGMGFAHVLGNTAMSATALRRQVTDAATLSMMPSGVRAKGARFADNNVQVQPLEFPEVDTGGQPIGNFIMPFSFKGPDQASLALLQETYKQGEDLSSTTEIAVGEGRQDAPVGTIMALLEAATRIESSVVAGLHDSLAVELKMFAYLFGQTLPADKPYPFSFAGGDQTIAREDFVGHADVVPVSDPNIASGTQRLVRAQFVQQAALQAPDGLVDKRVAYLLMFMELGFDDQIIQALLPKPPQPQPGDPLSENQMALMQKPLAVAPWQDHAAHIQVHQALAQLPNMAAHIQEHMGQQMRMQVEQILGQALPPLGANLPPQVQNQIAQLTAKAMAQMQAQAAAQAPGGAADPQAAIAEKALQTELAAITQKADAAHIDQETKLAVANIQSQDKAAANQTKRIIALERATALEQTHGIQNPNLPQ